MEDLQTFYLILYLRTNYVTKLVEEKPDAISSALDELEPHYNGLYGNKQWSKEAQQYFLDIVKYRNLNTRAPFGY